MALLSLLLLLSKVSTFILQGKAFYNLANARLVILYIPKLRNQLFRRTFDQLPKAFITHDLEKQCGKNFVIISTYCQILSADGSMARKSC